MKVRVNVDLVDLAGTARPRNFSLHHSNHSKFIQFYRTGY